MLEHIDLEVGPDGDLELDKVQHISMVYAHLLLEYLEDRYTGDIEGILIR